MSLAVSSLAIAQNQIDLPINWEGTTTNYAVTDFGGTVSSVVVDPTDPNNMVLQTEKTQGSQTWAGTTLGVQALATAIPFSPGNTTISVDVWSPNAGTPILLKVENVNDPGINVETLSQTTTANGWQTITFDFANPGPNLNPLNFANTYNMVSIFYNFGDPGTVAETYYCDNIVFDGAPAATSMVTFRVDLSEYTGSYTEVNLNGTFNNWCGSCAVMTSPNNDSIFELELSLPDGDTIEYKFTLDGWSTDEMFTPGTPCTKTTGQFTNRVYVPMGNVVLPAVCWESCDECSSFSAENLFIADLSVNPNPSTTGIFTLEGVVLGNESVQVAVSDIQGRILMQNTVSGNLNERIDLSSFDNGLYIMSITSNRGVMTKKLMISK